MHLAAHPIAWPGGRGREVRFDLEFPIGSLDQDLRISETLEWHCMFAAGAGEVDGDEGIRCVFLFDRNLNPAGIARNRDEQCIEDFVCFNRDPGNPRKRSFRCQDGGLFWG